MISGLALRDACKARSDRQSHVRPLQLPYLGVGLWAKVSGPLLGVRDYRTGRLRGSPGRTASPPGR
jgi:hypothetical protein